MFDSIKSVPLLVELKETLNVFYKFCSDWTKAPCTGESFGIDVVKPGEFDATKAPRALGVCRSHVLPPKPLKVW